MSTVTRTSSASYGAHLPRPPSTSSTRRSGGPSSQVSVLTNTLPAASHSNAPGAPSSTASNACSSNHDDSTTSLSRKNPLSRARCGSASPRNPSTEERDETYQQLSLFEAVNSLHLAFTMPSVQKRTCTEPVRDLSAALAKAKSCMEDMKSVGLSGIRLTGDYEHEYQFLVPVSPAVAGGSHAGNDGKLSAGGAVHFKKEVEAHPHAAAREGCGAKTPRPPIDVLVGNRTPHPLSTSRPTSAGVGRATAPKATPSLCIDVEATHAAAARERQYYAAPTLDDLRKTVDIVSGGSVSPTTAKTAAPASGSGRALHERPKSARISQSGVRQLKMFASPFYPDIPVAPHLTGLIRWCRTVDALRRNSSIRAMIQVADTTRAMVKEHEAQGALMANALPNGNSFVLAKSAVDAPEPKLLVAVRESKYVSRIAAEATQGIFERHLAELAPLVAAWCIYCDKDFAARNNSREFCAVGSIGNSSQWLGFCRMVLEGKFFTDKELTALYDKLNEGHLDRLTFGRFFFHVFLLEGVEGEKRKTTGPEGEKQAWNNGASSLASTTTATNADTLFQSTQVNNMSFRTFLHLRQSTGPDPATRGLDTPMKSPPPTDITDHEAGSAGTAGSGGHGSLPTLLELWFSWAGRVLRKRCKTVGTFHLDCIVNCVMESLRIHRGWSGEDDSAFVSPSSGATKKFNHYRVSGVDELLPQLRQDILSFQMAVGTRVEVNLDEALELLQNCTRRLGKLLLSPVAIVAEEELNAILEFVLQQVDREDKAEMSRLAAMQMQSAVKAVAPKRRKSLVPTRSMLLRKS